MNPDDLALIRTFLERYGFAGRSPSRLGLDLGWGLVRLRRDARSRLFVSLAWGLVTFSRRLERGARDTLRPTRPTLVARSEPARTGVARPRPVAEIARGTASVQ